LPSLPGNQGSVQINHMDTDGSWNGNR
jgi:hypothetical protein